MHSPFKLQNIVLNRIAKKKNTDISTVQKYIEKVCLPKIQNQISITEMFQILSEIYKVSVPLDVSDSISKGVVEEYVIVDGKTYPRYFPQDFLNKINDNPDEYILNNLTKTTDLEEIVKVASYLYYNFDGGGLTDNAYDTLEYYLKRKLKLKQRAYEKIGALPIEKIRSHLPYPMPSLNKVKPDTKALFNFINDENISQGYVISHKLDGVSGMVIYTHQSTKPMHIYTRGNGELGGDVSYLSDHIKFPSIKLKESEILAIRGEFVLDLELWKKKYKDNDLGYSNPRSFVSAKINSGHVSIGIDDISFVAYQIINSEEDVCYNFRKMANWGFEVVRNKHILKPTTFQLVIMYEECRKNSKYLIDGLVISKNIKITSSDILQNPKNTVAFKMTLEEQIRETSVLNVEWSPSRYGKLIPVVLYNNIYIEGNRYHRASGHNYNKIKNKKIGKGAVIKIARSGDVIPQVKEVLIGIEDHAIPPEKYEWKIDGPHATLTDPENNDEVLKKRIVHFFETINARGVGPKTIDKFYDMGYTNVKQITNMTKKEIASIKGFGQKKSESIYDSIHSVMRVTRTDRFMVAMTIQSNYLIGRKTIKSILRVYPRLFIDEDEERKEKIMSITSIKGLGKKRKEGILESIPKFLKFLKALNPEDIRASIENDYKRLERIREDGFDKRIYNKKFVLTGFMVDQKGEYEVEDIIYDNNGVVVSRIDESVDYVISQNPGNFSSKIQKANRLNKDNKKQIILLTKMEFLLMFGDK